MHDETELLRAESVLRKKEIDLLIDEYNLRHSNNQNWLNKPFRPEPY